MKLFFRMPVECRAIPPWRNEITIADLMKKKETTEIVYFVVYFAIS